MPRYPLACRWTFPTVESPLRGLTPIPNDQTFDWEYSPHIGLDNVHAP